MPTSLLLPAYRSPTLRGGRVAASEINQLASNPRDRATPSAADGDFVPILYGRDNLPGREIARATLAGDLVLALAFCVGPVDAIEMVQINDTDASTITGVTITTYLGTPTQVADPTLVAAIPAYNDSLRFDLGNGLRGIAYVVLRITPAAAVGGWPRVRATIRGLSNIYDPRTDTTGYSDNSALCLGNMITDPDFGLGVPVLGLSEAADWADSLLADGITPRARLSLTLNDPQPVDPAILSLMSQYAECFYSHEGAAIRLVPDSPVDLSTVPVITSWAAGSLSVTDADQIDRPNVVEVRYKVPRADALPWGLTSVKRSLDVSETQKSTVELPGVFQTAEADNKALSRLNRTFRRTTVTWTGFDDSVQHQIGDVVKLHSDALGILELPVRITASNLVSPGRYDLSGEVYRTEHYPSETPPVAGAQLPAGGIIIWSGGEIPANFTRLSAADGKLIVGAGGAYAQSSTGGTGWNVQFSGNTTSDGSHSGESSFYDASFVSGGAVSESAVPDGTPSGNPLHAHTYDSGVLALNPKRRQQRLIKATAAQTNIPLGGKLFGVSGITGSGWSRDLSHAGRLLEAADTDANTGADSQTKAITTGNANDAHRHTPAPGGNTSSEFATQDLFYSTEAGGSHNHTATLQIVTAIKRARLALYTNSADAQLLPGHIIAWEGGALPTDWVLCDGTNGTPDARDYFIEVAGSGNEGTTAGDNTATATATTSQRGHAHKGADRNDNRPARFGGHADTVYHSHTITKTVAVDPPYYALAFIMYSPGA